MKTQYNSKKFEQCGTSLFANSAPPVMAYSDVDIHAAVYIAVQESYLELSGFKSLRITFSKTLSFFVYARSEGKLGGETKHHSDPK